MSRRIDPDTYVVQFLTEQLDVDEPLVREAGLDRVMRDIQKDRVILSNYRKLTRGTDLDKLIAASIAELVLRPMARVYADFEEAT